MSKTAESGDMQGDHIKGTINADTCEIFVANKVYGGLPCFI